MMSPTSAACCSIPPVIPTAYHAKGEFRSIDGLKTYVTGPQSATKAILVIYGMQALLVISSGSLSRQSKAVISYRLETSRNTVCSCPTFFEDEPADIAWFPPTCIAHEQNLDNFFRTKAVPDKVLSRLPGIVAAANKLATSGQFDSWSILGYCWGGKMACLASGQGSLFKAAIQCHPAMLAVEDASSVTVPMAVLASKDESVKDVESFCNNLRVPNYVETFPTQIHGWMAARSDLQDIEVRRKYEQGYRTVLKFCRKYA
ncbi:hypothetical protein N7447_009357 [Penicillium robsamsonii]|uniref:uncharacterized protein n=1 Tax=Penicillium robsamsonii TaxID=1792511 RepID=UPI002547FC73|nr:uncharacterized protein N7447_009357 [Penicillium robsamsonii]KAJ5817124.1 hypothetical protein N7447_009357 [Penicillium robsamsonii]